MMNLTVIRKRNGTIMPFDASKITVAVSKAFKAVTGTENMEVAAQIKDEVLKKLHDIYDVNQNSIPYVEQVQDVVEQTIIDAGYYDIGKHYILYRHERALERAEKRKEEQELIEEGKAIIINRNGKQEKFNEKILREFVQKMVMGYEKDVSVEAIVAQVKMEIYDGITSEEFMKAVVLSARSMIEHDPAYTYVAARMQRYIALKDVYPELDHSTYSEATVRDIYKSFFKKSVREGVEVKILDGRIADFDLEKLSAAIDPQRDELFQYMGMQTVYERYLIRDLERGNKLMELPQTFWMRVAMGLAIQEKDKNEKAIEFYNLISKMLLVPSTPTLFQSGTAYPQLSSCYLNTIDDTLESLSKVTYADNAQLSKYSGGIATDWSYIRGMGSIVKKTRIESNGVIPFMKIADTVTVAINRSGRRRGAVCGYLETWHCDIEDFLDLRKNTGDERRRTHDMNTSNWIPDLFMERVRMNQDWTLFSPDEVPGLHDTYGSKFRELYTKYEGMAAEGKLRIHKTMKAVDLYRKMISMIFETGHPWFCFKDACNIRSPQDHDGVVHNSNLCTEITLNNSFAETAVCNLASINLPRHFVGGKMDLELMKSTIKTGMRMLDNVIDINLYPTIEGKVSNEKHRPVGLGLMGFHDALFELGYAFDSKEALKFADENMEFISYYAILGSTELAAERGAYATFKGSKWDRDILPVDTLDMLEKERGIAINVPRAGKMDWTPVRNAIKQHGMRNSNTMAIAPTATISNIAGASACIESYYKNIYVKSNMSGEFTMLNNYLVYDLKKLGLWNHDMLGEIKTHEGSIQNIISIPDALKLKYKETFEIDYKDLINMAAYRGKWIDQSQSLNLFFRGTSGKGIADMYMYAWEMGLKTTYYLRTLAASSVEKATVAIAKKPENITIPGYTTAPQTATAHAGAAMSHLASAATVAVTDAVSSISTAAHKVTDTVSNVITSTVANVAQRAENLEQRIEQKIEQKVATAMHNVIENTKQSFENIKNSETKIVMVNGKEVKLTRILDATCEACQ
jgi:ribonucleoside-diphosphate reductase alpha chain